MITDEEIAHTLRQMASRSSSPRPSAAQWDAIQRRRARGERVAIPTRAGSEATPWLLGGAGLALLAAVLAVIVLGRSRPASRVEGTGPVMLLPGTLMAQPANLPAFPVVEHLSGQGIHPGRWTYAPEPLSDAHARDTLLVFELRATTFRGSEAWLALAGKQVLGAAPVYRDSTWLSRGRLDVLGHQRDTLELWQPLVTSLQTVMMGTELDSAWKASFPLAESPSAGGSWFNLRVYGQETIEVPAGRYVCWKVGFRPTLGFYFWITADGSMVRQGMSRPDDLAFGKMNLALVRYEDLR